MSGDSLSTSRRHVRGPPSGEDRDRHIQQIIDHTSSLFPDASQNLPQIITTSNSNWRGSSSTSGWGETAEKLIEYDDLDEFDRSLLGRPQPAYHSPGNDSFPHSSGLGQHLSQPMSGYANRPNRVLGDASHHFRPFVRRGPEHRSQFEDTSHQQPERQILNHAPPIHGVLRYSNVPQTLQTQLPIRDTLTPFEPREQSTYAPSISQSQARRGAEPQRNAHHFAPLGHNVQTTPTISSSLASSSPPNAGHSSPSARVSREKQRRVVNRDCPVPKWNQNLELDLDHAPTLLPIVNNTRLVDPRQSLPDKFRAIFPFQLFNAVQSKCFPLVYETNDNVVISAPTGSGKTAILEMAICKLVSSQGVGNFKIVYQAPTKSLCSEKARDWQKKFSHMNLSCVELTGDTSQVEAYRVGSASIIVTTPEKWDSITRKWKDHRKLLDLVRLVLIDEVHILKDSRGATLEAVVSRMKTIGASIRFVAISATVPNIDDVAQWIGRDHQNQHEPARFEVFGEELRPVKLQRYVYGYEGANNDFIFEKTLDGKLNFLIAKHSEKKPIMVFCFTRKSCERTAQSLAEWWSTCRADDRAWPPPRDRIPVLSQDLQELVRHGVAFHHAGLDSQDRAAIEAGFLNGQLHVICCTSTLAVGVNLPCHTVVLKGTSHYTDDGPQEYSDLEVMQMLGRAGRPQFDSSATAIIMTKAPNTQRYEKLVSGEERLESTLHQNLLEHINSEIGLGTIQDIPTAKKWISGTFLSVRLRKEPQLYNLGNIQNGASADEQVEEWCERNVKLLQEHELVSKRTPLVCTEYGQAMSKYMIQFETMISLLSIPRGAPIEKMLQAICMASEFKDFRFKPAERAFFRELNKSPLVLHPIKETLSLTWHKIFMIVQIHLGGVDLPTDKESGFIRMGIQREKRVIFDRLRRLVRCVIDCKVFDSDGLGTKAGLELSRSIAAHAWEGKPAQLSQIPGFGPVSVRKWTSQGVPSVLAIADKSIHDIERIASRNPPYGRGIQKTLENFPRLTLKADIIESRAPRLESDEQVSVTLRVHLGHRNTNAVPTWKDKVPALTFIAHSSDGNLAYIWRGTMKKLDSPNGLDLKFPVAITGPKQTIFCYFSCEEIVGTQVMKALEPNIPASVFRNVKTARPNVYQPKSTDLEADYDCISDDDMLEALGSSSRENLDAPRVYSDSSDESQDEFPLIDELLEGDGSSKPEPPKMDNGRYFCNHYCRNRGLTKTGKACNHKCCHEGIDKYRPPKQQKNSNEAGSLRENEMVSQPCADISETLRSSERESMKENPIRPQSASTKTYKKIMPYSDRNDTSQPPRLSSKEKRRRPNESGSLDIAKHKRTKLEREGPSSGIPTNVEYVDLHDTSDDSDSVTEIQRQPRGPNQRNRENLLVLHEEVNGHGIFPQRMTKSYNVKSGPVDSHGKDGLITAVKTNTSCTNDLLDDIDELSDLPELDELFFLKKKCEQPDPIRVTSPQITRASDETLYPGVVQRLKESMDYG